MIENKESLHQNGIREYQQSDEYQYKSNLLRPFCKTVGGTQLSGNVQCLVTGCRPSNITQKQKSPSALEIS
jgi:hypothetical protein